MKGDGEVGGAPEASGASRVTDGPDAVPPREALSYEQARDKLAAVCEEWLDGARARLAAAMAKRGDTAEGEGEDDAPF